MYMHLFIYNNIITYKCIYSLGRDLARLDIWTDACIESWWDCPSSYIVFEASVKISSRANFNLCKDYKIIKYPRIITKIPRSMITLYLTFSNHFICFFHYRVSNRSRNSRQQSMNWQKNALISVSLLQETN